MTKLKEYLRGKESASQTFLQKLISFDTTFSDQGVYGKERDAQLWLEQALRSWGWETRLFEPDNDKMASWPDFNPGHSYTDRPNLVAVLKGSGGGKSIILNGHMDTVPLDDLAKWTHSPLSGEIVDGKLYGRGACDMKAGLVAMTLAAQYLCECYGRPKGDIIVQSVVDEEGGGNGTLACITEGYTADAAIVTEPTGLDIYCASRGVFLLEVKVEGKPSHACFKWQGVNALEKGIKIANGLAELERRWLATRKHPLLPSPTITLGQMEGGISAATVPGTCIMRFDVKYLPCETDAAGGLQPVSSDAIVREVEDCIRTVCQGDEWLREHPAALNWYLSVMPHSIDMEHPLIGTLAQACDQVMGKHALSGLPSGADARHLQNNGKIPTVLFGPGSLANAHSIDEHVELAQYFTAIEVLAEMLRDWTG